MNYSGAVININLQYHLHLSYKTLVRNWMSLANWVWFDMCF